MNRLGAVLGPRVGASPQEGEWRRRPVLSFLLRAAILCVPMAASLLVSSLLTTRLPAPSSRGSLALWCVCIAVAATVVFIGFQRAARRLLPLAALLDLTLIFPDRAPARFAVARRAGRVRDLQSELATHADGAAASSASHAAATVLALITAITAHDRGTRGHSERTRVFTDMIATELGLSKRNQARLRWAALLHDVGKLSVPATLLNKPGKPDAKEWAVIRAHPEEGVRILGPLLEWLGPWGKAVEHHHEKFNGTGYPHGLAGSKISRAGRIVAVADAFETMTAPRPYKRALSVRDARAELVHCSGTHFDPVVVRAFLNVSVGRLRRAVGVAAWLGQLPAALRILSGASGAAQSAGQSATAAIAAVGLVAGGVAVAPHLHSHEDVAAASPNSAQAGVLPSREAPSATGGARSTPGASPTAGGSSERLPAPSGAPARAGRPGPGGTARTTPAPGAAAGAPGPGTSGGGPAPNPAASPSPSAGAPRPSPAPTAPPTAPPPTALPPSPSSGTPPSVTMPNRTVLTSFVDNGPISAAGSFSSRSGTSFSATVSYGDGSGTQVLPLSGKTFVLSHSYQEGTYTITVWVRDNTGAVGSASATAVIGDAKPIVSQLPTRTITLRTFVYSGSFTDPGGDGSDTYTATVNYGDGPGPLPLLLVGHTFTLSHVYVLPGIYTVKVTIIDSGGAHGQSLGTITA